MGGVCYQDDVFLVTLDPTVGHEIRKSRPCAVLSPDEMNQALATVMIAPMTTQSHPYPSRVAVPFAQKPGWVVLDQIRTVDRRRLIKRLGRLEAKAITSIPSARATASGRGLAQDSAPRANRKVPRAMPVGLHKVILQEMLVD